MHVTQLQAKRRRLLGSWMAALALAGCASAPEAPQQPDGPRPNVVLIVLDTTRADFLSPYGYERQTTPALQQLAKNATLYSRAFATDFWTLPSHASLLTGLSPIEAGATSETNHLPDDATTIAERLAEHGYITRAVVANSWLSMERGFGQGFQQFEEGWRRREAAPTKNWADKFSVNRAVGWIRELATETDRPFFLFVNINTPHLPYNPPDNVLEQFASQDWPADRVVELTGITGPWRHLTGRSTLGEQDFAILRDLYAAEMHLTDRFVGTILAALKTRGLLERSLVIITSDHGENLGDHGLIEHTLSMYDTTLHVPLLIRYPDRFAAATTSDDLVSITDVYPTILDVTGIADDSEREWVARASLCSPQREPRSFVLAENLRPVNAVKLLKQSFPDFDTRQIDRPMRMIRTPTHKLIWRVGAGFELYDLVQDPGETENLADRQPELREELLARLQQSIEAQERREAPLFESQDEEALERLRALGYI